MSLQGFIKRRKPLPVILPPLYKDAWTLIASYCEWPEKSALRMTNSLVRDAISLDSIQLDCILGTIMGWNKRLHYGYIIWGAARWKKNELMATFSQDCPNNICMHNLSELVKVAVRRANCEIRPQKFKDTPAFYLLGMTLGQAAARFARSHNYIKCSRPKNWNKYFE